MIDIIKIIFTLFLIIFLLKKKMNIGYVMLIASLILFILYLMPFPLIIKTLKQSIINDVTIKLFLALTLIRIFEMILREHNILKNMMNSIKVIFKKRKLITISMPLLIGLMPSVGGAYFSAPMVAETTKDLKISPEEKSFINYWFRHPWEFILPLYPGILLASAITKIELHNLISANLLFAFLMLTTGFLFSMKGLRGSIDKQTDISKKGLWSFAPIISVLCFVLILHVELHLSLLIVNTFLLVFYKYKPDKIFSVIKYGFSLEILILIFGVMLFKETLESSGAVGNLSRFFIKEGVPLIPILFLLPFITGFLTGITVGFVGSTFPLIINITNTNSINIISFAFASGFLGVLLSPVHICLILTKEYFKADMAGIYKIMITPCLVVMAGALIEYLILTIP